MSYCMYLRKSRADVEAEAHGEGETLLRHERALREYAKKLNIYIPPENVYREIVSGETIEARPEMQRLLNDVTGGKWEGVFVMEVERLARGDTSDQGTVAKAFKYSLTKIYTPAKVYDPNNEYDEEYFEFSLFMSRREYKTINRRQQRGRIDSVKEGKFISSMPPYGYEKVKIKNAKGFTLKQDPEQAPVVKMIYDWYVTGDLLPDGSYVKLGATRIADKLNNMGIRTATGIMWSKSSVIDILRNPVYAGKVRWAYKKEIKLYTNGQMKKKRTRKSGDYILVDGLHEPIVNIDLYNTAQDLMKKRGHAPIPGSNVLKNSLAGLVYCKKCGGLMTRLAKNNKTPYDALKCMNSKCDTVSSPLYLVEDVILKSLSEWLRNFKVNWDANKLNKPYDAVIDSKRKVIEQLRVNHGKLLSQKDRIHTLLEEGVYTTEVFLKRYEKVTTEILALEKTMKECEIELVELKKQAEYNDVFIPKAQSILDAYSSLQSAAAKNEALKELLEKVTYYKSTPNKKGERDNRNFEIELYPRVIKF